MTPAERLHARLDRMTANMRPDLARSILRAFDEIAGQVNTREAERIIERQVIDLLFANEGPISQVVIDNAFNGLRAELRSDIGDSARTFSKDIPGGARPLGIGFNILNPKVIEAVRTLETRVITTLSEGIRESVKQHVQAGIEKGVHPRTVARGLRDVIPLSPTHEQWVRNYRAELEAGDIDALNRRLRNRSWDRMIKSGQMTPERIDKAVEAYRKRLVSFNAETNARTAANDAQKLGQRLSWQDAIDKGLVTETNLMERWSTSRDDRVRPSHVAMDGEVKPWGAKWSNGQTVPGDDEFNCRCVSIVFIQRERAAA